MTHRFLVGAAGGDVVEYPFLVAGFFLDVLGDGFAQPFQAFRQRAPQAISSGTVCLTWW